MTNKQKWLLAVIIVFILLIVFLVYYFRSRKQIETCPDGRNIPISGNCADNPALTDTGGNTIVVPVSPDANGCIKPSSYIANYFPLATGMKGNLVEQLQTTLNNDYKTNLTVDGYFGCFTFAAIKKNFNVSTIDAELFKNKVQKV